MDLGTRLLTISLLALGTACGRPAAAPRADAAPSAAPQRLPRLVDLGANKCIPCKAMAPVLDELRRDFAGRFEVEFIDVWKQPEAAEPFGARIIPTQVFLGADGRELSRHEGYMGREEILERWRSHGLVP